MHSLYRIGYNNNINKNNGNSNSNSNSKSERGEQLTQGLTAVLPANKK